MPGARKAKKGQTEKGVAKEVTTAPESGMAAGVDTYDGRANLGAGDMGKEPGGRWSPAYYESGPKVIGKIIVRDVG